MKWNMRMVAAQRDIWRPTQLQAAFAQVGFHPSLSKVAALWGSKPISLRLDDLDKICAALDCNVEDLLQPEPVAAAAADEGLRAVGDERSSPAAVETARPRPGRKKLGRPLPPN